MPTLALGRTPSRRLAVACSLLCLAVCALALAPIADANIPAPASLSLPVRAPSLGGSSVGALAANVTFTDTKATATASAPAISLGPGNVFHVDVCIKAHSLKKSLDTKCDEKTVDTHSNTVPAAFAAPTVQASMDRPGSGGSAYFSFILSVQTKQSDGSFKEGATSWPVRGTVAQSAIGVPLLGAATAVAPKVEGVPLSTGATGGIDTGNPDSFCMARQYPDPGPPGQGVSTSGLGSGAPAYYEVGEPSGAYEGQAPKGVMLLVHGGGWYLTGAGAAATERSNADRWRARGWRTLNMSYRPCGASFADVQWFYDQARQQWGSAMPYCASGSSAGGHLALMLAASRSTLNCVEDDSGPTDATTVKDQKTLNPNAAGAVDGGHWVYNLLSAVAGPEMLVWWSPALFPIHARALLAVAANDWYVPWGQATELQSKMQAADPNAYVDPFQLSAGSTYWVHSNVADTSLDTLHQKEDKLVAPLVQ